ncbi:MAG TPA: AIR synthase-related protein, partial [Acidimicrobiales bacterium]|nr:AIR synthase-related protein [Acidimicrobiales bacterium]
APRSLADELLTPSVVYAPAVLAALRACPTAVHACAHVTGGGIPGNLSRVLPQDVDAVVDRRTWDTPRIFGEIARLGEVTDPEMTRVFNLGLGMILAVASETVDSVLAALDSAGSGGEGGGEVGHSSAGVPPPVVVGEVVAGTGSVRL